MRNLLRKSQVGFTLVELLVVIAIIGILSTVTVVSLNMAKAKARDAKRIADITQVRKAIDLYFIEHNRYPNSNDESSPECFGLTAAGGCNSVHRSTNWIPDLIIDGYFTELPQDPINSIADGSSKYFYYYTRLPDPVADRPYIYNLYYRLEVEVNINNNCPPFNYDGVSWAAFCDNVAE